MSSLLQLMPGLESGEPAGGMGRETGGGAVCKCRKAESLLRQNETRQDGTDWVSGLGGGAEKTVYLQGSRAEQQQDEP